MPDQASRERARLTVILITVGISVIGVSLLTLISQYSDWKTSIPLNVVENALLIIYAIRYRDTFILYCMLFGLMVGLAELPADAWLVAGTKTLDYSVGGGPMIWRSPLMMPLAWEMVAVQFGYIGLRLWEWRRVSGLLLTGLLGILNIPFYEEVARTIHWWTYDHSRMLLHTPYYIIIGEFLIAICLALCARVLRQPRLSTTILAGITAGLLIFPCYALSYWLAEKAGFF